MPALATPAPASAFAALDPMRTRPFPAHQEVPMTKTYYAPRPRPVDPRAPRLTRHLVGDGDVRGILGADLPAGFSWARRPRLALIRGGDPAAPGLDERAARTQMLDAIRGGTA
ncbi:hypothetical protein ACIQZB_00470 [Streptomyces sp. NPDC097727]|uniref:hypothetical protein n=1 Tax=Streptomyces sp. NPDC097727 TaxID=3366092 RepID=UPI0037F90768